MGLAAPAANAALVPGGHLTIESCTAIGAQLPFLPKLSAVDIHGQRIGDAGLPPLLQGLQGHKDLTSIDLNSTAPGELSALALASALPQWPALRELHIYDQHSVAISQAIAPALACATQLERLAILCKAASVAEAIQQCRSLHWLRIAILDDAACAELLRRVLAPLTCLTHLDIAVQSELCPKLSSCLLGMSQLKTLIVSSDGWLAIDDFPFGSLTNIQHLALLEGVSDRAQDGAHVDHETLREAVAGPAARLAPGPACDTGLLSMAKLRMLTYLSIGGEQSGCTLGLGKCVAHLVANLPELRFCHLGCELWAHSLCEYMSVAFAQSRTLHTLEFVTSAENLNVHSRMSDMPCLKVLGLTVLADRDGPLRLSAELQFVTQLTQLTSLVMNCSDMRCDNQQTCTMLENQVTSLQSLQHLTLQAVALQPEFVRACSNMVEVMPSLQHLRIENCQVQHSEQHRMRWVGFRTANLKSLHVSLVDAHSGATANVDSLWTCLVTGTSLERFEATVLLQAQVMRWLVRAFAEGCLKRARVRAPEDGALLQEVEKMNADWAGEKCILFWP